MRLVEIRCPRGLHGDLGRIFSRFYGAGGQLLLGDPIHAGLELWRRRLDDLKLSWLERLGDTVVRVLGIPLHAGTRFFLENLRISNNSIVVEVLLRFVLGGASLTFASSAARSSIPRLESLGDLADLELSTVDARLVGSHVVDLTLANAGHVGDKFSSAAHLAFQIRDQAAGNIVLNRLLLTHFEMVPREGVVERVVSPFIDILLRISV